MKWRQAPLYVEICDLAAWTARLEEGRGHEGLRHEVARRGRSALCEVSRALVFPDGRHGHIVRLDATVLDLRVLLTLGRDLGVVTPRQHRFVSARLDRIGRMIGGWRRSMTRRDCPAPAIESSHGPLSDP